MQCTDLQGNTVISTQYSSTSHCNSSLGVDTVQVDLQHPQNAGKPSLVTRILSQLSCLLKQSFPGTTWVTLYSTSLQTHSTSLRCPGKVPLALQLHVGVNNLCVSCLCLSVSVGALLFYKTMFTNSITELYKQQDCLLFSQLECQDACRQIGMSVSDQSTHCAEMCFRINISNLESLQSLTARYRLYALGSQFWY